uniref:Uncharacterized protein n=1 Tax=Tetraodon nigroviridis TaxID=99883 RepID=H3C4W3_TETNG
MVFIDACSHTYTGNMDDRNGFFIDACSHTDREKVSQDMRKKKLKMRQQLSYELYFTAVSLSHNRTTLVPPTSTTSQMETASGSACTRTTGRTSATQTEVFNVCGMDYLTGSWVLEDLYSSNIPGRPGVDQRRDAWTVLLSPWSSFLSSHQTPLRLLENTPVYAKQLH